MALPSFVENATGLDDGVVNKMASGLEQLKSAKKAMDHSTSGMSDILDNLDPLNLPNLPSQNDLLSAGNVAESLTNSKLGELDDIMNLTGSCFDGAMNSLKSIMNDGFGFIEDILSSVFSAIPDLSWVMEQVFAMFAKVQQMIASLGIDKLIGDMMGSLGCLSDSSMISDITSEVDMYMNELGLDSNGMPDNDTFYEKMKSDLNSYAASNGIDTSYMDSMAGGLKTMTETSNNLSQVVKNTSDSKMKEIKQTVKNNIPKTPAPPSFF